MLAVIGQDPITASRKQKTTPTKIKLCNVIDKLEGYLKKPLVLTVVKNQTFDSSWLSDPECQFKEERLVQYFFSCPNDDPCREKQKKAMLKGEYYEKGVNMVKIKIKGEFIPIDNMKIVMFRIDEVLEVYAPPVDARVLRPAKKTI